MASSGEIDNFLADHQPVRNVMTKAARRMRRVWIDCWPVRRQRMSRQTSSSRRQLSLGSCYQRCLSQP